MGNSFIKYPVARVLCADIGIYAILSEGKYNNILVCIGYQIFLYIVWYIPQSCTLVCAGCGGKIKYSNPSDERLDCTSLRLNVFVFVSATLLTLGLRTINSYRYYLIPGR